MFPYICLTVKPQPQDGLWLVGGLLSRLLCVPQTLEPQARCIWFVYVAKAGLEFAILLP